jgi:hypothetical protein
MTCAVISIEITEGTGILAPQDEGADERPWDSPTKKSVGV